MAIPYQQQSQPGQQSSAMQYQGDNSCQKPGEAQLNSTFMSLQLQTAFDNVVGPYGHFDPGFVAPSNTSLYNFAEGQMGFNSFAAPDPVYAKSISSYTGGVISQPPSMMYNGSASNVYGNPNVYSSQMPDPFSFSETPSNVYNGQNSAAASFSSAFGNADDTQSKDRSFKSSSQHTKPSRPTSTASNTSNTGFQKKSFATSSTPDRHEGLNRSSNSHKRSISSTPFHGGPVHAPQGASGASPEKFVSKSGTPESLIERSISRENNSWIVEDTDAIPTPVSKPHPSDAGLFSVSRSKTPQLRSRRGQTITSASNTAQKMLVADWAGGVSRLPDAGDMMSEELDGRGSPLPINTLSLMILKQGDPFACSAVAAVEPFRCMTPGRFTAGFGSCPLSQELMTLTNDGTRNPTLAEALDPYNLPFSEYCRQAKSENYGVIKIKNVCYRLLSRLI